MAQSINKHPDRESYFYKEIIDGNFTVIAVIRTRRWFTKQVNDERVPRAAK